MEKFGHFLEAHSVVKWRKCIMMEYNSTYLDIKVYFASKLHSTEVDLNSFGDYLLQQKQSGTL